MELNPQEVITNNLIGTENLIKTSSNYNVENFVLISTDKAVNTTNCMGASKRLCEILLQIESQNTKTIFSAVRFGNVLASNGSVVPRFKQQIQSGGPITVTHPEVTRFFMTIPEAVQLVLYSGTFSSGGEIFILDMGEPIKIVNLAKDMIKLSGLEEGADIDIKFTGLRPGEKLYEELSFDLNSLKKTPHQKINLAPPSYFDKNDVQDNIELLKSSINIKSEDLINLIIKTTHKIKPIREKV